MTTRGAAGGAGRRAAWLCSFALATSMMGLVGVAGPRFASAAACPERTAPSLIARWGTLGTLPGRFDRPSGIAVNAGHGDQVYVADTWNHRIQWFQRTGRFIGQWGRRGSGDGQFIRPGAIAIARRGWARLYVVDIGNYRVQKFSRTGVFIGKWGSRGDGPGQFADPRGIATDSRGYVYVTEQVTDRVQMFTSTGRFVRQWGRMGDGPGEFHSPNGIAVDSTNRVYVADFGNGRIQKFRSDGAFMTQWEAGGAADVGGPVDVAVGAGVVYVVTNDDRIQKFDLSGRRLAEWRELERSGISVGSSHDVYVTKYVTNHVRRLGCAASPDPGPGGGPF